MKRLLYILAMAIALLSSASSVDSIPVRRPLQSVIMPPVIPKAAASGAQLRSV
jgi:hypothetical protein